jgi:hypothetical protein
MNLWRSASRKQGQQRQNLRHSHAPLHRPQVWKLRASLVPFKFGLTLPTLPMLTSSSSQPPSTSSLPFNLTPVRCSRRRRSRQTQVIRTCTVSCIHHLVRLSRYDLEQPATHAQMMGVCIMCDMIPQWPVDLQVISTSLSLHRRRCSALPYLLRTSCTPCTPRCTAGS